MTLQQQKRFWAQFAAACRERGLADRDEMESFRKQVMFETCHAEHLGEIRSQSGYEKLMARLAEEAGDWETAIYYSSGEGRRYAAMIEDCCEQIFQLRQESDASTADYIAGVLRQSGLVEAVSSGARRDWRLDLPADSLHDVFCMLDTHRRRLVRAISEDLPLGYRMGRFWTFGADGVVTYGQMLEGRQTCRFSVNVQAA